MSWKSLIGEIAKSAYDSLEKVSNKCQIEINRASTMRDEDIRRELKSNYGSWERKAALTKEAKTRGIIKK